MFAQPQNGDWEFTLGADRVIDVHSGDPEREAANLNDGFVARGLAKCALVIGAETFSGAFQAELVPEFSEAYTFLTASDDGVALLVKFVVFTVVSVRLTAKTSFGAASILSRPEICRAPLLSARSRSSSAGVSGSW